MPNYSSSSVKLVDWAMGYDGCLTTKKRNLLENLQTSLVPASPTPTPPPFEDFINLVNPKKRAHTSLSICSTSSDGSFYLPQQTPSPSLDHTNCKYAKIRARPIYNFKYDEASIWTQSPANALPLDMDVVNKFFAKETQESKIKHCDNEQRSRTSSMATTMTRPFQLLDKSLQITYDVTMRHLLQLLAKSNDKNTTIDDVLRGIDTGNIHSEWLQCVQRLNKTLHKQFQRRPADRLQLETYPLENLGQLNTVEQFLIKLLRVPNYSFKLKCYQYRDELHPQLVLLSQSIGRLIDGVDLVLGHESLPRVLQLLCFLYNIVSNKCVPGLDFISLVDALNSPTNQSNKTVAHVLVEILDKYHRSSLMNIISDETLLELKKVCAVKYEKLYVEIREIYQQYQRLDYEYSLLQAHYDLPSFISSLLSESKLQFERLFQHEQRLVKGEQDLAAYFCSPDLSVDACLSTVGQFVDKLRLANAESNGEQQRRASLKAREHQRLGSLLINTATSFVPCVRM